MSSVYFRTPNTKNANPTNNISIAAKNAGQHRCTKIDKAVLMIFWNWSDKRLSKYGTLNGTFVFFSKS